jgi:hypothetical protein
MHPTYHAPWREQPITMPQVDMIIKLQKRLMVDLAIPQTKGEATDLLASLVELMATKQSQMVDDDDDTDYFPQSDQDDVRDHMDDIFSIY